MFNIFFCFLSVMWVMWVFCFLTVKKPAKSAVSRIRGTSWFFQNLILNVCILNKHVLLDIRHALFHYDLTHVFTHCSLTSFHPSLLFCSVVFMINKLAVSSYLSKPIFTSSVENVNDSCLRSAHNIIFCVLLPGCCCLLAQVKSPYVFLISVIFWSIDINEFLIIPNATYE